MINLILTSKARLLSRYGEIGLREIADRAETLRQLWQQQQPSAPAHFVYLDDAPSLKPFGLRPILARDPAAIRRLLADIEAQAGQIDHLLLLGGPLVIPWWRLDNPVLVDDDPEILSDNPYGCRDDDWHVPDRKLGRLPDAEGVAGADATPLLTGLETAINARQPLVIEAKPKAIPAQATGISTLPGCSLPFFTRTVDRPPLNRLATPPAPQPVSYNYAREISRPVMSAPSFGYTAAIWEQAATLIYRTVQAAGSGQLLVCPPTNAATLDPQTLVGARFLYFNLHGVPDRPQWFGQSVPPVGVPPTYPDALLPRHLVEIATQIKATAPFVFSEACFGAWIEGKRTDDAICLQLLALGVSGFVGSTVTSYGRSEPPLSEADLLTELYFTRLYAGDTAAQALTRAKAEYASRMLGTYTYLDEDDRKTLLEFVLYGDPMLKAF